MDRAAMRLRVGPMSTLMWWTAATHSAREGLFVRSNASGRGLVQGSTWVKSSWKRRCHRAAELVP